MMHKARPWTDPSWPPERESRESHKQPLSPVLECQSIAGMTDPLSQTNLPFARFRIRGSAQAVFVNSSQAPPRLAVTCPCSVTSKSQKATPSLPRPHYLALLHIFDTSTGRCLTSIRCAVSAFSRCHHSLVCRDVQCQGYAHHAFGAYNLQPLTRLPAFRTLKSTHKVPLWCRAALHDAAAFI